MKANRFGYLPILFTLIFLSAQVHSQFSATSTSAQTVATSAVAGGVNWTSPTNIQAGDGVFATSLISGTNISTYNLDAMNWGFQSSNSALANYIPPGATINGVEVYVTLRETNIGTIQDNKVILLKAGAEAGTSKARNALWPSTAGVIRFGSSTDLWGSTWALSDLTNTGFGVRISAKNRGTRTAQAEIDYMRIVVYFNQTYYYSGSSGNLELTGTWGKNTNGTGPGPANFTTAGQVFFLQNRTSTSLTGNLTVSGTNSKMVIGDGTAATALTIPASFALNGTVDVAANSSLTITNTTLPTIGTLADNSTVTYNAAGSQNVQDITYSNLTLAGSGTKTLVPTGTTTTVNNQLNIGSGIQFNNSGNNINVYGASTGITNNGTASGTGRYAYIALDASSSTAGTGSFSNLEENLATSGGTRTLTLGGTTSITGSLVLTDGTFSNGSNLTMSSGSTVKLADGILGSSISGSSGYDVVYDIYTAASPKVTANELTGTVRNMTLQTGSTSFAVNLNKAIALSGNLTITSGTFDPTTSNFGITIAGNYSNNGTFTPRNSIVTFNGSGAQTIGGSASQTFYDLVINNSSGGVQLSTPVSLTHGLTLTSGLLTTNSTNSLTIINPVSVSGGSATSYINGPLIHSLSTSSGTCVFPIGKNGAYRPATLNLVQNTATATNYTGEVFAGPAPTRTLPAGIVSLSPIRYYTISCSNNANVSSATVTLNYSPDENTVDNSILRIAKSSGPTTWANIGGMGTAPGTGTITSTSFNSFSDFVIGFSSFPLPLHWLSFDGLEKNGSITLDWQTSDETDCSHFSIERSLNHSDWEEIGKVTCKNGLLNSYSFVDNILSQQTFYRIKLINRDGSYSYSTILTIRTSSQAGIRVLQNPVAKNAQLTCIIDNAALIAAGNWNVSIMDYQGRTVLSEKRNAESKLSVSTDRLPAGTYFLVIKAGPLLTKKEFMVQ